MDKRDDSDDRQEQGMTGQHTTTPMWHVEGEGPDGERVSYFGFTSPHDAQEFIGKSNPEWAYRVVKDEQTPACGHDWCAPGDECVTEGKG